MSVLYTDDTVPPETITNTYDHPNNGMKIHGSVVVGSKGQIVIPSDVRKTLAIEPGDTLFVITKHEKVVALIKMEDISEFMECMRQEMEVLNHVTWQAKRDFEFIWNLKNITQ